MEGIRKTYKEKKNFKRKKKHISSSSSGLEIRSRLKVMLSFRVQETYLIYLISISTTKAQGMDYGKLKVSLILQLVKTS